MAEANSTIVLAVGMAFLAAAFKPASATEISVGPLSFSDERGGFTLISASGSGTLEDPFVVVEEVFDRRQAILVVRGMRLLGNRIGTQQASAFALRKIVINRTPDVWLNFQVELREVETRHSPYEDGLSFGQNTDLAGIFTQSSFPTLQRFDEPQDTLGFSGAQVAPGESAHFQFIISDTSPIGRIFVLQEPLQPVSRLEFDYLSQWASSDFWP